MGAEETKIYTILIHKKKEVNELKSRFPLSKMLKAIERNYGKDPRRNFKKAIAHQRSVAIIGEIKKASPSEGILRHDFNALKIAEIYEYSNIKAISVLTETHFFKGRTSYLKTVRAITSKPILRKDFIIDRYQIFESALYSADAVLLIASILTDEELKNYIKDLRSFDIDAVVEVHNQHDLNKALNAGATIIGINNRNLSTFEVDLEVTEKLVRNIPKGKVVISESGINRREDIQRLRTIGVNAFLIGTAFMRAEDTMAKVNELLS
jgi:indole-3-glycerol phosphate synthase